MDPEKIKHQHHLAVRVYFGVYKPCLEHFSQDNH